MAQVAAMLQFFRISIGGVFCHGWTDKLVVDEEECLLDRILVKQPRNDGCQV